MADDSNAPIILSDADVALAQAPIAGLVLAAEDGHILRGNAAARALLLGADARTRAFVLPAEQTRALLLAARDCAARTCATTVRLAEHLLEVRAGSLHDGSLLTWLQPVAVTDEARARNDTGEGTQRLAERLALVTDATGVGIWSYDLASGTLEWDTHAAAMIGWQDDLAAPQLADLLPLVQAEDRARMRGHFQRLLQQGGAFEDDARITDCAGRARWLHVRARRDLDGAAQRIVGVCLDVTQLRSAESRARAAAERLALATAAARLGVWDWRPGEPIEFDAEMCELYGVQPGTRRTFEQWVQSVHPDDRGPTLRRWHTMLAYGGGHPSAGGDAGVLNFRITRPDGGLRDVRCELRVFRDGAGEVLRVLGSHLDVSDLRAAERAAQRTAERLLLATSAARIGTWDFEVATRELAWDAQQFRLFGHAPDAAPPISIWRSALHAEDRARVESEVEAAIKHGIPYDSVFRIVRADGATRWLAARGVVHGGGDRTTQRLIGVNWDVTDAREAEAALRAKETAERANRAKSEFVSKMSHELRTPLNALLGFAQLLEMDPAEPPTARQHEHITRIRAAGWHLLNLINDVLDLSRIESGLSTVAMEVVELEPLVLDAMALIAPQAAERNIRLSHATAASAPRTVWADGTRLRQVLLNLLSNAVKFNRVNGAVTVEIAAQDEDAAQITVRDTGPGISAAHIESIFSPFSRRRQQSVEPEGSGIGLAISRRLIEQMRGQVDVESRPGEGSAFRVTLRRAVVAQPPAPVPAPLPLRLRTRDEVRGTVLYIEDDATSTSLVEHLLHARPNVRLYKAADGATGVMLAAACQPGLVLIDMQSPDTNGYELLRQLHEQPETAGVPCVAITVAITAQAKQGDERRALEGGFAACWTKPLDAWSFLEGIDSLLARARDDVRSDTGVAAATHHPR
jgi:hypothetical protein